MTSRSKSRSKSRNKPHPHPHPRPQLSLPGLPEETPEEAAENRRRLLRETAERLRAELGEEGAVDLALLILKWAGYRLDLGTHSLPSPA